MTKPVWLVAALATAWSIWRKTRSSDAFVPAALAASTGPVRWNGFTGTSLFTFATTMTIRFSQPLVSPCWANGMIHRFINHDPQKSRGLVNLEVENHDRRKTRA